MADYQADYQITTDGESLQQVSRWNAGLGVVGQVVAGGALCYPTSRRKLQERTELKAGNGSNRMAEKGQKIMDCGNGGHGGFGSAEQSGLSGIALADLFERFDRGRNHWHAPIQRLLDGLTAEQALWKPAPGRHCIWQIVRHMNFWRQYVIAHLGCRVAGP